MLSVVLFLFHVVRNAPGVLVLFMHDVYGEGASVMSKATFMASFYRGYVLTQLPGAFVAHRSGGKMVLWYSIMGCSLAMLGAPLVATGPALSACMAVVGKQTFVQFTVFRQRLGLWLHSRLMALLV